MESAPKPSHHPLGVAMVMIVGECNRKVGEPCTWTRSGNPDGFDEFIAAAQTLLDKGAAEGSIAPDHSSIQLTLTRARLLKMNEQLEVMMREMDKMKPGTLEQAREYIAELGFHEPTKDNPEQ